MARDHYLPAAFIGRFSTDTYSEMRARRVWVNGHGRSGTRLERSSNIGVINNYYRLIRVTPNDHVTNAWDRYEDRLTTALDELADSTVSSVDATTWLRVLVPFVAGIFVRTPDFARKFEANGERLVDLLAATDTLRSDNTNMARLMAMHRVLSPIMAARWIVAQTNGPDPLITNDIAYVANQFGPPYNSPIGWSIPLNSTSVLQLIPCPDGRTRDIMFYAGSESKWRAFVEYTQLPLGNHVGLNRSISQSAHEFILGSTYDSVQSQAAERGKGKDTASTISPLMLTSHRMQIVHEFEWYRAVSAVKFSPGDNQISEFEIDWAEVGRDWSPATIFMSPTLPTFTTGLSLRGRTLVLGMTAVPGFTDYAPGPWPWQTPED